MTGGTVLIVSGVGAWYFYSEIAGPVDGRIRAVGVPADD
jgi:hypothetical protein